MRKSGVYDVPKKYVQNTLFAKCWYYALIINVVMRESFAIYLPFYCHLFARLGHVALADK